MKSLIKRIFHKKEAVTESDGGVRKHVDTDAPKAIVSEQIIAFETTFSTVALAEDAEFESGVYTLSARLVYGAVRGEYKLRTRCGDGEQFEFRQSHVFLEKLQSIVKEYDLAKYNGIYTRISGLPDMYGTKISIVYASGERIDAGDNQDNFLSPNAMKELVNIFLKQYKKTE